MKYILIFLFTFLFYSFSYGQTATELYNKKDYKGLVKLDDKSGKLTPDELYMVGFAFFQLGNDNKAIEFYNKAIVGGLNKASVYFYKGLSLRYLKRYDEALTEIETALRLEPTNQEYMNEKGIVYYYKGQPDTALAIFKQAEKLPNTDPEPYYWIGRIYHERKDFNAALLSYYQAVKLLPKTNSYYLASLENAGLLEYSVRKNYTISARLYSEAIQLDTQNYQLYYQLIKSYNAANELNKADSVFDLIKTDFREGKLPKEDMALKTIPVSEFEWNGHIASVEKSLVDPKDTSDIYYKVLLLNKTHDRVDRHFVVERTFQPTKDSPRYLLYEEGKVKGSLIKYPYGWPDDYIPLNDLQRAVILVLDGKLQPAQATKFNNK